METIQHNPVVSREEWLAARLQLLEKEKKLTRLRDQINAERPHLPWVRVDKQYTFDGPTGKVTLDGLFNGRCQLIVQHFMFGPGWAEGCPGCSFQADHVDGSLAHIEHHDVSYTAVSRATLPEIEAFKKRMGWKFGWVSSFNSDFNYDMHVSFTKEQLATGEALCNCNTQKAEIEEIPGMSIFYKDENGDIFQTYSAFDRGVEELLGTYMLLDLTPKGRDEKGANGDMRDWVRHHDKYEDSPKAAASCCCS